MNGGTHLGDCRGVLRSFQVFRFLDQTLHQVVQPELEYRENPSLLSGDVVVSATFSLKVSEPTTVKQKIDEITARRKATQPLEFPSCGSVFKNPEGTPLKAWEVVDQCGLRGKRIGGAMISDKHPNWILNVERAKAQDVRELILLCKKTALSKLGIKIQEEVRAVSFQGELRRISIS
ncbi:MAG: hypothetical protein EOP09_12760 [Proteobacteria bacterium]|nr:MAG: hypothetical protein EOP09_12760 [Pseudomonadota bacterium]